MAEQLVPKRASVATTRGEVSALPSFWTLLEVRGEVPANVWLRLSSSVKESTRGVALKRRPWTNAELESLLTRLQPGDILVPLTVLLAFTGCRLNEIAGMKITDVTAETLNVREGKTSAAVRVVPLCPTVRPLVKHLVASQRDGYLLPGMLSGGIDGKRGHLASKRFGLVIRKLGFEDPALTMHSLRNSYVNRAEEAGVPQTTVALIVGHTRSGQSYGGYSKGLGMEVLQAAAAKITYGQAVDAFAMSLGTTFKLSTRSRRRCPRAG